MHNGQVEEGYFPEVDLAAMNSQCDTEALLYLYRRDGEHSLLKDVPGAYTMALADWTRREVLVMRDRTGIKPGVLGWKDGKYGVASRGHRLPQERRRIHRRPRTGLGLLPDTGRGLQQGDPRRIESCLLFLRVELHRKRRLDHQPRRRPQDPRVPRGDACRGVSSRGCRHRHLPAPVPRGSRPQLFQEGGPAVPARFLQDAGGALFSGVDRGRPQEVDRRQPSPAPRPQAAAAGEDGRHDRRQHHPRQQLDSRPPAPL